MNTMLLPLSLSAFVLLSGKDALPPPQTSGGMPVMQALKERTTSRAFSSEKLPAQKLSNLLWAANGINRPESGRRTAPSAMNMQEIDVYVIAQDGTSLYDAKAQSLIPVVSEDLRPFAGGQPFVKEAPLTLVFVADHARMAKLSAENKEIFSYMDASFVSQNVYLYCASEGLATVVRAGLDKAALAKAMKLRPDQKIVLAQNVGYPKK